MDTPLASRELCEEYYNLTNIGKKFEVNLYYDPFNHIRTRKEVMAAAKRTLPKGYTPIYELGFLWRQIPLEDNIEDLFLRVCIEYAKHNLFRM